VIDLADVSCRAEADAGLAVRAAPVLDDPAVAHPQDRRAVDRHGLARGRHVVERVTGVGAGERPVRDHEVVLLDEQVDAERQVGERSARKVSDMGVIMARPRRPTP
jgi:hypothetical protein